MEVLVALPKVKPVIPVKFRELVFNSEAKELFAVGVTVKVPVLLTGTLPVQFRLLEVIIMLAVLFGTSLSEAIEPMDMQIKAAV